MPAGLPDNMIQSSGFRSKRTHHLQTVARLTRDAILAELKAERDRVNAAIAALEGGRRGRGRPPNPASGVNACPRRRWRMSAEARKNISEAKKRWWAGEAEESAFIEKVPGGESIH